MTLGFLKPSPNESAKVHMHFSYSQLNTYLISPMKYRFQYVQGVPWEIKPVALPFEKGIHRAAETYYRNIMETGEITPVDQVIKRSDVSRDYGYCRVKAPVTRRPPHRAVREDFPHTVPR